MKWLLALVLIGAVAAAVLYVPPKTAARMAARGLRATWDWVDSLGREEAPPQKKQKTRKAQAATPPQRKAGREGIVAQPPKEKIAPQDREALDDLVSKATR